jgi:hypothetical protein
MVINYEIRGMKELIDSMIECGIRNAECGKKIIRGLIIQNPAESMDREMG